MAGVVTWISVELTGVTFVTEGPPLPKITVAGATKPVPVIVMAVPPDAGPQAVSPDAQVVAFVFATFDTVGTDANAALAPARVATVAIPTVRIPAPRTVFNRFIHPPVAK